jgi:hypothetical protein
VNDSPVDCQSRRRGAPQSARWVRICPKGYFEPDVEFGRDGWIYDKV